MPKRDINLLPEDILREREFKKVSRSLLYLSIFVLIVVLAVYGGVFAYSSTLSRQLNSLEQRKDEHIARIRELEETERQLQVLGIRAEIIANIMSERKNYSRLVDELSTVVPGEVSIGSLSVEGDDQVRIQGSARNYNELTKFIRALRQRGINQVFVDAEISSISLNSQDGTVAYSINTFIDPVGLIDDRFYRDTAIAVDEDIDVEPGGEAEFIE